jgi:hypothetical protein
VTLAGRRAERWAGVVGQTGRKKQFLLSETESKQKLNLLGLCDSKDEGTEIFRKVGQ